MKRRFIALGSIAMGFAAGTAAARAHRPKLRASEERVKHRSQVDREDMQRVYDNKPRVYKVVKRGFDVVSSGAALVALSPLMAATAAAIIAEDGLPVIYAAPREGQGGKPFKMYKFRSMYRDAESRLGDLLDQNEQTGPAFKIKDDPRVTKVGHFIRKWSIDELPQLVNILKGDMSVVGPRAIQKTQEFTKHEAQREVVQPGLTCYWQVGGRSNTDWDEWVELDLDYIQDMNPLVDAKLIAETIPAVLKGEGSY